MQKELSLSWSEVRNRAWSAARVLAECGIKAGDRVAIVLPTCPEFIDVRFGGQVWGAVPVPLYPPLRLGRLDEYHQRTLAMLSGIDAVAIDPPTVSLDFSYYLTDGKNEHLLGLDTTNASNFLEISYKLPVPALSENSFAIGSNKTARGS